MNYPYSLANYPTSFKGFVVSPTKICIQFNNVQVKTRTHGDGSYLTHNDEHILVSIHGTDLDGIAVGCQMPVVEDYQLALIDAYKEHYLKYRDTYRNVYNKNFKSFLRTLKTKISNLLHELDLEDV